MSRRKVSTTVYLNPEHQMGLYAMRLATQIPVAQLIRNAISEYLERAVREGRVSPVAPVALESERGREGEQEMEAMIEKALRRLLPMAPRGVGQ